MNTLTRKMRYPYHTVRQKCYPYGNMREERTIGVRDHCYVVIA